MRKARGFSLIELIVVIGIILVLAGLLLPTLASARVSSAKSVDRMDMRSLGLVLHLYAGDNDDSLPAAYQTNTDGRYLRNRKILVPFDWAVPQDDQPEERGLDAWPNSAQGYWKDSRVFKTEIVPDFVLRFWPLAQKPNGRKPVRVGQSFNGLLSHWNLSAISSSSDVPLFSQVYGGGNMVGFSFAAPALVCPTPGPCLYTGSSFDCSYGKNGTMSTITSDHYIGQAVYARQQLFLTADLSAKSFTISKANFGSQPTNPATEFFARYERNDIPFFEWKDQFGCHALRFRPDFDPADLSFAIESGVHIGVE